MRTSTMPRYAAFARLIPYLAVLIGLLGLHNAWAAALGYHLGMITVLSVDHGWRETGTLWRGKSWALGVMLGIGGLGGGLLLYLCWPLLGATDSLGVMLQHYGLTRATLPPFIVYFSLVNAWLEELFWRNYLDIPTEKPFWNDAWFAGYHLLILAPFVRWPWLALTFLVLATTAWLWRLSARHTAGLLIPTISHLTADISIMLAIYALGMR